MNIKNMSLERLERRLRLISDLKPLSLSVRNDIDKDIRALENEIAIRKTGKPKWRG